MTQDFSDYPLQGEGPSAQPSAADVAREQASWVGQSVRESGGQVAGTAAERAKDVLGEAQWQARDLLGQAQGQARDQARTQQQKAAGRLHELAEELSAMAANGGQNGMATDLAQQASGRLHGAASWLEQREPGDLLDEVRDFARRRPGVFVLAAAVAGIAAGRLTRGAVAAQKGSEPATAADTGDGWAQPAGQSPMPASEPVLPGSDPVIPAPVPEAAWPAEAPSGSYEEFRP